MSAPASRARAAWALRLVASLVLTVAPFAVVLAVLDPREIAAHLEEWRPLPLAAAFAGYLVRSVLGGLRLRALCGSRAGVVDASAVHALGSTFRNVIPFGLGEAAYVALLRRRMTDRVGDAVGAAVILRVLDLATTTLLLTAALPLLLPLSPPAVGIAWAAMAAVSLGLAALVWAGGGARLARLAGRGALGRLGPPLADLGARLRAFRTDPARGRIVALSLGMQAAMLGVFVATCRTASEALGLRASLFVGFLLWPFSMLPVKGVLDFGTHETAWTVLLALLGFDVERGVAIALSTHLVLLALTLGVGGLAALRLALPDRQRLGRALRGSPGTALAALVVLVALLPGLLVGEVPAPLDLLVHHPPWRDLDLGLVPGSYVLSDQVDYYLPLLAHLRHALAEGVLPFWSDALQLGAPFLAVANSEAPVAPLALAIALLGTPAAYTLAVVARTVIGAVFFQRWMGALGVGSGVATIGALVFAFNSYPVQRLGVGFHLAYSLLPGALLGVDRIVAGSRGWVLGLPVLLALLVASGYPPVTAFCAVAIGAWALFRLARAGPRRAAGALGRLAVAAGLGVALALPLLLGTLDFAALAETGYRARYWDLTLEPRQLVTLLLPFWFGDPGRDATWIEQATYLGALPLLAIPAALALRPGRPERRALGVGVLAVAVVAWGVAGFDAHVYAHLPFFAGTKPRTWIAVGMFALSALACLALDDVVRGHRAPVARRRAAAAAALAAVLLIALLAAAVRPEDVPDGWLARELVRQGLLVALALGLLLAALRRAPGARWLAAAGLLVAVDLVAMGTGWNRTAPAAAFYPPTPGTEWMRTRLGHGRILALDEALPAYTPLAVGLRPVAGRGFPDAATLRLLRLLSPDAFTATATYHRFARCDTRLTGPVLDLLAVRYVVTPPETRPLDLACEVQAHRRLQALAPGRPLRLDLAPGPERSGARLDLALAPGARPAGHVEVRRAGGADAPVRAPVPRDPATPGMSVPLRALEGAADAGALEVVFVSPGAEPLALRWVKVVARLPVASVHDRLRLVYDGEIRVWENLRAFERAFLASRVTTATPEEAHAAMARTDDLRRQAWVSGADRAPHPLEALSARPLEGGVEVLETRWNRQRFRVHSSRPALLVVSDRFAPDWSVRIDGEPATPLRVDDALRGVAVPGGESLVEWSYAPPWLVPSLTVAGLAAAGIALAALACALRRLGAADGGEPTP